MRALLPLILTVLTFLMGFDTYGQNTWVREYYDYKREIPKCEYQVHTKDPKKLNGIYIHYYQNGMLQSKGKYINNFQNGSWAYFYQNGSKKSEGSYLLGDKTGIWDYYYESGTLSQTGRMVSNKKQGYWKYFYEAGGVKSEGEFILDKAQGLWNYFNEDGTLKATCVFTKGKGIYTEKFSNGKIRMLGLIRDGGSDSTWTYYYENGTKKAEGVEKNGIKIGSWRFYYSDKSLNSVGDFVANQETGPWTYYYPNGQVSSKGLMEAGRKQGIWHLFYENGKFMGEAHFENGYGKYKEFFDNGKTKLVGYISGNLNTGSWMYYYDDGTLEGECFYINGEGDYLGYYPDGSKKMSGRLKNGKKIGVWKLYDQEGNLTGLYKSYFDADEEQALKDTIRKVEQTPIAVAKKGKRTHGFRLRYSQLFKPRVNENHAIILGINPVAPLFYSLPVSAELYFDKRVGYELGFILLRRPFAESHTGYLSQLNNSAVVQGASVFLRQKLYFGKKKPDTYYFGQELRYTLVEYSESARSYSSDSIPMTNVHGATENKAEVSLLLGKRFFFGANNTGNFCLDIHAGLGVGYRFITSKETDYTISDMPTDKLTLPLRFGVMLGYKY